MRTFSLSCHGPQQRATQAMTKSIVRWMARSPGLNPGLAMTIVGIAIASPAIAQAPFHLQEATIASIHEGFANGTLTCTQLTRLYLDRIEAYNLKGPALHAIITVNRKVLETAAEMDRQYAANRTGMGSL